MRVGPQSAGKLAHRPCNGQAHEPNAALASYSPATRVVHRDRDSHTADAHPALRPTSRLALRTSAIAWRRRDAKLEWL